MKYHVCINVEESIKTPVALKSCIVTEAGKVLETAEEVREFLSAQHAEGKKYLPYGDCDNFDYQTGCKGHQKTTFKDIDAAIDEIFDSKSCADINCCYYVTCGDCQKERVKRLIDRLLHE